MEEVPAAKYLGINIQNNIKWDSHINSITDKANRTLEFLRRKVSVSSTKIKSQAYFGLVKPQLEYAATVWDPYTPTNISQPEQIQRRAARYVTNRHRKTFSVSDKMYTLKWKTLWREGKRPDFIYFTKLIED